MEHESIYCHNNPYGYNFDVNNPKINDLYQRYKRWKGLPLGFPLSDEQRFEFESYIAAKVYKTIPKL